jgi:hypothetical protein
MIISEQQREKLHANDTIVLPNYGESYRPLERFEIEGMVLEVVVGVPGMHCGRACQRVVVKLVGAIGQ